MLEDLKYKFKHSNALLKLVYINLAVFVLIHITKTFSFLFQNNSISLVNWFGVPSQLNHFIYKPWSVISYMFTHDAVFHILVNLLWLYFSGKIFLQYFNAKKLYSLYLIGGIAGALAFLLAYNFFPALKGYSIPLIGASASVLAILFAVATYVPNFKINLLFLGAIPIKYLAIGFVLIDLISIPKGNAGGHIAHLGGALIGMLFIYQWKKGNDITLSMEKLIASFLNLFKKKHLKTVHRRPKTDDEFRSDRAERSAKIDAILDKIAKSGYDSLTEKEKEYLFKNSKNM